MLFNSYIYIALFLPVTVSVYYCLNKKKLIIFSKYWLIFCSLFFYSWWDIFLMPLLLASIFFNFTVGTFINNETEFKRKKILLVFGLIINVGLLIYFKYTNFILTNLNILFSAKIDTPDIILPLGISFFTFQQITYLVDSFREKTKGYNLLDYSLFISFFPHLIAGPILHHGEMMPQFQKLRNKFINYKNISSGLYIFIIGLFKKVVVADTLSTYVGETFDAMEKLNFIDSWIASLSYTFQIYFDFSGYIDMAIGSALLLNIELPFNFNSPYKSLNIGDFWRRWNITLGRFLKNYIYIPLGGNRKGEYIMYFNIITTFLIGGVWHGAGWNFILWGLLNGFGLVLNRIWERSGFRSYDTLSWFLTFNFVNISWVFFRAKEWKDAQKILEGMFGFNGFELSTKISTKISFLDTFFYENKVPASELFLLVFLIGFTAIYKNSNELLKEFFPNPKNTALIAFLFCGVLLMLDRVSEFLYFNF